MNNLFRLACRAIFDGLHFLGEHYMQAMPIPVLATANRSRPRHQWPVPQVCINFLEPSAETYKNFYLMCDLYDNHLQLVNDPILDRQFYSRLTSFKQCKAEYSYGRRCLWREGRPQPELFALLYSLTDEMANLAIMVIVSAPENSRAAQLARSVVAKLEISPEDPCAAPPLPIGRHSLIARPNPR